MRRHFLLFLVAVSTALFGPPAHAQTSSLTEQLRAEGAAELAEAATKYGDARNGAVLFHQPMFQCSKCHAVDELAGGPGPNLASFEKDPAAEELVESILWPSKAIREGYRTASVLTVDGLQHTGVLVSQNEKQVVLQLAEGEGKSKTFLKSKVDDLRFLPSSIMPEGLLDQLPSRKEFLDLSRYVLEVAERGVERARELQPLASQIGLPPLPEYESHLDHAGLIEEWNAETLAEGKRIYNRVCANCHGTHDREGSLPTSPRFASSKLKNGSDPLQLYQTLTHGYGLMVAQRWMVPQQKYAVIHYLREAYFRKHNPELYTTVDRQYMSSLPPGDTRGPEPVDFQPWVAMDYGPSLNHTYEIRINPGEETGRDLGRGPRANNPWANPDEYFAPGEAPNYAYKGIAVRLDGGPGGISRGRHWMVYDHDTMNLHAGWSGNEFIDYCCIQFDGQHAVHNRLRGTLHVENSVGPGWAQPLTGAFADPRPVGRDGRPYGPLPKAWLEYQGLYHYGNQTILSYRVGGAQVLEMPSVIDAEVPIFVRRFSIGPAPHELRMRVATNESQQITAKLHEDLKHELETVDEPIVLTLPPSSEARHFQLLVSPASIPDDVQVAPAFDLHELTQGGAPRWPERVKTRINTTHDEAFAVDQLELPRVNPWNAQVRPTGLDFFADHRRAAVCTWDGDVWIVDGIHQTSGELVWQRIASGLFQPLGLKIVNGQIFVTCRDQLVRLHDLNGDLETDFYECFNNDHQVTEHFHEFAMGLQTDDAGNFYYAKSGRHAKRAVVPHHGTLLRITADGTRTDILATGFRAANGVCINPDGSFFVTDQEGHWNPKNRINWVTEGGFYGNMYSFTDHLDPADDAMEPPLCWITNRFDRSPAELLWVPKDTWGPFAGRLLSLSYGYGKVFLVPHESVHGQLQGGMIQLPIPDAPSGLVRGRFDTRGDLFVCGMFSWAGSRQEPGCFQRIRYTGKPSTSAGQVEFQEQIVRLTFSDGLAEDQASELESRFELKTWDLKRTANYGSRHHNEKSLEITQADFSDDAKVVTLHVPDLAPTWGLSLTYRLKGQGGKEIRGEFHGSIHHLQ